MIRINSGQFSSNQAIYFNMAEKGEQVMINHDGKSFLLTPVDEDELILTPELEKILAQGRKESLEGKTLRFTTKDDLANWLNSL